MLTTKRKSKLRKIKIYVSSCEEVDGKPIIRKSFLKNHTGFVTIYEEIVIPPPYKISQYIFQKILDSGFSKIEKVSPSEANCVIRVFQKLHYEYDSEFTFNIYGAVCYVKDKTGWFSENNQDELIILDYSKFHFKEIISQDEQLKIIDADFVDIYVKVS